MRWDRAAAGQGGGWGGGGVGLGCFRGWKRLVHGVRRHRRTAANKPPRHRASMPDGKGMGSDGGDWELGVVFFFFSL